MRSLLRWLRRLALSVLALGGVALVVALVTAHTAWGREWLRQRIEVALRDAFPGGARVAAVDGSVLGTLTLRGVELDAADRRPLITAATLDVSLALWPLAFHTARFDRVVGDDVRVFVRDQPPLPPAAPARPGEPSPWQVELPAVELHRTVVDVARAALALGDLDVSGAATIAAGRIALSGVVHGRWSRAGGSPAPLAASGDVVLDGGVRVSRAVATLGGASIAALGLAVDPDHPAGWLAIAAPAAAITALLPELDGTVADAIVVFDASPDGASTRLAITAAAGESRLWAALRGEPARRAARGVILANDVDLTAATRGRVGGRGSLAAAIDVDRAGARGVAIAQGEFAVADLPVHRAGGLVIGSLDDAIALALGSGDDALQLAAVARGHRDGEALVLDQARTVATARGISVPGQRVTGALAVDARLAERFVLGGDAHITGLAIASGVQAWPTEPGDGRAVKVAAGERMAVGAMRSPFALRISHGDRGPRVELAVRDATATAVARGDLRVAVARASLSAAILPELRLDDAQLDATGVRRADSLLGDARVTLERRGDDFAVLATARPPLDRLAIATRASLRHTAAGYQATLGATRVDTPDGAAWIARGGSLAIPALAGAAIRLRGVALHRDDASIAVSGDYVRATGALAAHVDADRVDLATLGLGPDGPRGLGRATLELTRRGGRWQADAALAVSGFAAAAEATPVDATAHLALGPRVTLDARATGAALGELELAFDAAAPVDPFDLAGWRALDRSAIRTAAITARSVALPGLLGLFGTSAPIGPVASAPAAASTPASAPAIVAGGTLDGTIDLAPGAPRGDLKVHGIALPVGNLDGNVRLDLAGGDLRVAGFASLRGIAAGNAMVRLAIPKHPFDPVSWPHRGRDLLRDGWVHLHELTFDPELLARVGLTRGGEALPYRGRLRAQLLLGAGGGEARLAVDVSNVTGGPLVAPVSEHIEVLANPVGTRLHAELHGSPPRAEPRPGRHPTEDLALGVLDASVRMTLDRWLDEPLAVLGAPLSATWTLPRTPVAPMLALLGRHELVAGTLEGNAEIRGTVAAPMLSSAQLVLRNARVAPRLGGRPVPELRELSVEGSWEGTNLAVAVTGREANGGELRVLVSGGSDALDELTGTAQLTRLDIAPIAAFLPGALASAAGVVDGELALGRGGRLSGKLHVAGGALPLAATIGTLRDATADLTSDGHTVAATLDGRLGRGTIHVAAHAPADDLAAVTADVQLRQVSPIAALRPIITADLKAQLHRAADQLRGEVTVARASVTLPEHSGAALLDVSVPADLVLPGAQPPAARGSRGPARPWLVVDVNPGTVRVDARELAEGVGFLGTLRSDRLEVSLGEGIGVRGTLDIENADADIVGRRYAFEPSAVVFDGTIDPRLDLHMSHAFPELTLKVDVLGRASHPEPRFSSDAPGYSNDALFTFFLGGEPSTDTGSPTRDQARVAVAGAGARLVSSKLGRQITKVLPVQVDAVSCEPDPGATTSTAGSCTVGKWLSERLFVAYRQHLQPRTDENTGDVQLQLRMGNHIAIEATGGDRGHYSADLLWRQRW